ncbi:hypothetical protein M569_15052, partial [Genlisea aurea]
HVVILPSPGIGHLFPLVQFAKRLNRRYGFTATFIIPVDGPLSGEQKNFLDLLPPYLEYAVLPPVNFDDLPTDAMIETRISLTVTRSLPALRDAVGSLIDGGKRVAAFVVDLFGTDGFDVAAEFGIPSYVFYPPGATALSLFLHLPELDEKIDCEYRDMPEQVKLPGCIPMNGSDLLDPVQDRKNEAYKWLLHHCKRYKMADGIILNSFKELEPGPIEALQKGNPIVYPVGPLIRSASESSTAAKSPCIKWLDEQPIGSVLFVSFGSGGTLSHDQIIKLAHGLESSEQKFLWVLRCPATSSSGNSAEYFFRIHTPRDPLSYLPPGFTERTRSNGLVVPSWAPQAEILEHPATGGFLTHCGWNSVLESIVSGVPFIAWPLYAEQRMNAVILHEDMKVALRPKTAADGGSVDSDEIAAVIKRLMEGEEGKGIRSRMRDLKDAAARALAEDGGASNSAVDELARR